MKPCILMSPSLLHKEGTPGAPASLRTINFAYGNALAASGGVPACAAGGEAADCAARFDGLLLTGGGDPDPALYSEPSINDTVDTDSMRDAEELALFEAFYRLQKPILGICRGIQLINVALGGTLWQDIPAQLPAASAHSGGTAHSVTIHPGSVFSSLFGTGGVVNSYHHQAVNRLAPGLRSAACAQDGLIEAVYHDTHPLLAVQWHPERMLADRPAHYIDMRPLFDHFVALCTHP